MSAMSELDALLSNDHEFIPWDDERRIAISLSEAAEVLGVQPATLRQQIARGKLRGTKMGRDWWLTPAEVKRYAAER